MGKQARYRKVQCYHCRAQIEVSPRAMTMTCPRCNKRLQLEDVTINVAQGLTKLQTCGRIIIEKKGSVRADLVEAHEGIEVLGSIRAKVMSGGPVVIGEKAKWHGDCRAPSVRIGDGAKIEGGYFEIASFEQGVQLGLTELPGVRNGTNTEGAESDREDAE